MEGPAGVTELQLLDDDPDAGWADTATVERDPTNGWRWLWLFAGVIVVIGVVGWLLDQGDDGAAEREPTADPDALGEEQPVVTALSPSSELAGDATPSLTPEGVPEGIVLGPFGRVDITTERVAPPGIPASTAVLGHTVDGAMVAIDADGRVTQVLQGDSRRYLPQVSNLDSIVGTLTFTGEWLTVDAAGVVNRAQVDDDDAPLFIPGADGNYVVHSKRSGSVAYMSSAGVIVGQGPTLIGGTRIVGDSVAGLVVVGLDGGATLIDHLDGSLIREIDGRLLLVGSERYVVTTCEGGLSCSTSVRSLVDDGELVLPVDPQQAERLFVGLSPSGHAVAYREARGVTVADTATGEAILRHEGPALGGVTWLGDKFIVLWEPDGTVVMGTLIGPDLGWVELDLAGLIDPTLRGLSLLAAG
ncbi:MAG: hypothetical protein P8N02_03250 [Actinomycetota bacterium]|jgi:hypothetical protein|nr:hypothetical protein [Actinomycetota bacterium]